MAAQSTAARQKLCRKRESHLERMLLPDAPPRKRHSKTLSPERQACVMVNPPVKGCVELNAAKQADIEASTSIVPLSFELLPKEPTEIEAFDGVIITITTYY